MDESTKKPFKILSIDGGGIRGVFPAMFLTKLEQLLITSGNPKKNLYEHFDLICGTSTGGIIALSLALGISADEICDLYIANAVKIFGKPRWLLGKINGSSHNRTNLEQIVRDKFKTTKNGSDPILGDCKTNLCIPIYDLLKGKPSVLKTKHHLHYIKDFHIPAYQVAMATSAAPTYFDPYSTSYIDQNNQKVTFSNKVDGGVVANNPTLIGIIEAREAFNQPFENLKVLSIGTGHQKFTDGSKHDSWGLKYWMLKDGKRRLIDLFMQGQSQQVQNIIGLLQNGIDKTRAGNPAFIYNRIDVDLDDTTMVELDDTDASKLETLSELAVLEFQSKANMIMREYCT